jgi:TPR repeat protein
LFENITLNGNLEPSRSTDYGLSTCGRKINSYSQDIAFECITPSMVKNHQPGLKWLRRAAYRGDPKTQYNLGRAYANGHFMRKNYAKAQKWLLKASIKGHAKASRLLRSEFAD